MSGEEGKLMTLSEVAGYLQVAEKTVMRMINRGEIPAVKIGSQWRFSHSMIDDWILSNMQVVPKNDIAKLMEEQHDLVPLSRLVHIDQVIMEIKPGNKREILSQLIKPLIAMDQIRDEKSYLDILMSREEMMTTAIGPIAFPHARNPRENESAEPQIIIGICPEGTDFGSLDGSLTYLFMLPFTDSEIIHLRLMAKMAGLFKDGENVRKVLNARKKEHVVGVLIALEQQVRQDPRNS